MSVSSVQNGSINSTSSIVGGGAAKKAKGSAALTSSAAGADDSGNDGDVASPDEGGIAPNGFAGGAASPKGAGGVFGAPKGLDDTDGGAPKGLEGFSPSEASLSFGGAPKGKVDGDVPNGVAGVGGTESRLLSFVVSISVDGGFDVADENGLAGDSVFFAKGLAAAAPAGGADPKGEAGAFLPSDSPSPASFF